MKLIKKSDLLCPARTQWISSIQTELMALKSQLEKIGDDTSFVTKHRSWNNDREYLIEHITKLSRELEKVLANETHEEIQKFIKRFDDKEGEYRFFRENEKINLILIRLNEANSLYSKESKEGIKLF